MIVWHAQLLRARPFAVAVVLCLQLVPFSVVVRFTLFQLVYLLGVWALTTWAGIGSVAFPVPIMALVPLRQYVLPRVFKRQHLDQLDAASYEEAPAVPDRNQAAQVGHRLTGRFAEQQVGLTSCCCWAKGNDVFRAPDKDAISIVSWVMLHDWQFCMCNFLLQLEALY
eukprot:GHRR01028537.1.p1 GENE.GHRR01028537.1~~GHRR01028537.1.p1  ORF type:complete len:168 (-),score=41.17 GHRR01028537.1:603-1106(-)